MSLVSNPHDARSFPIAKHSQAASTLPLSRTLPLFRLFVSAAVQLLNLATRFRGARFQRAFNFNVLSITCLSKLKTCPTKKRQPPLRVTRHGRNNSSGACLLVATQSKSRSPEMSFEVALWGHGTHGRHGERQFCCRSRETSDVARSKPEISRLRRQSPLFPCCPCLPCPNSATSKEMCRGTSVLQKSDPLESENVAQPDRGDVCDFPLFPNFRCLLEESHFLRPKFEKDHSENVRIVPDIEPPLWERDSQKANPS